MDEVVRRLLDQMAAKPPRSKLEPHLEVIQELRRKGRTYLDIADFFSQHFNLRVAPSTIHAFVKVRARRRKRPQIELPQATASAIEPAASATALVRGAESKVKECIEALKLNRVDAAVEKPKFEYNEKEPLRLRRTPGTGHEEQKR
jgi:hypothetical protein